MNRISYRGVIARLAIAGAVVLGAAQAYAGPLISVEISGDVCGRGVYVVPAAVAGRLAGLAVAADVRKAGRILAERDS